MITALFLMAAINSFAQGDTITARKAKSMINKEVIKKIWLPVQDLLIKMAKEY